MKTSNPIVRSLLFFIAAFSLSGVLMGIQVLAHVPGYGQLPMYGPTLATLLFLLCQKRDLAGFLKSRFAFRVNLPVVLILAVPIAVNGLISYWTHRSWGLANVVDLSANRSETLLYMALMFPAVIGEEIGWRGYLLPELQERLTPLASSLVLGVVWGLWHTPTKLVSPSFFLFWFVQLLGFNFVFTLAYNRARPSIWSAILLHYVLNVSGYLLLQQPVDTVTAAAAGYSCVGLLAVALNWKEFSTLQGPGQPLDPSGSDQA